MTAPTDFPTTVDAAQLRRAAGRIPTSIAVVAGHGPDGPVGLTVGSLSSVSVSPPLVNFFGMGRSRSFAALSGLRHLSINVLDESQEEICFAFASSAGPRFAVGDWDLGRPEAPVLRTAAVAMVCEVDSVYPAGDHTGLMARVEDLTVTDGRPLVFYRGLISRLHPHSGRQAKTNRFDWWAY